MGRFLVTRKIQRDKADPKAGHLHWKKSVWCNAHVTEALVSTAPNRLPSGWVGLKPEGVEVSVHWTTSGVPGAIQVVWGPTEETLEFSFVPILELYNELKVEYGWIRRLPFRVADGVLYFHLTAGEVMPSVHALRRWGLLEGWHWT